jgi:hypothetical protein
MQSGGILIPPFVVRIFKSTVFLQIYVPLTLGAGAMPTRIVPDTHHMAVGARLDMAP